MIRKLLTGSPLRAAAALLLLSGCAKNINNKEAVRAAIIEYFNKRQEATDLNVANLNIQIASVSFQQDQAQATVSITPHGSSDGMQMSYALVRKGDKWEVKSPRKSGTGSHGGGAVPGGPGAVGIQPLPPDHPPTGGGGHAK